MRGYNNALWCVKKHLLLSDVHSEETIQKLARECNGSCSVSDATRLEAECIVKNLAAAEEHIIDEIIPQIKNKDIRNDLMKLADDIRSSRQLITNTGLPFRTDVEVDNNLSDIFTRTHKNIDNYLDDIDNYATLMEQEISCPRCEEDIRKIKRILNVNHNKDIKEDRNKIINTEKVKKGDIMAEIKDFGIAAGGATVGVLVDKYVGPRLDAMMPTSASLSGTLKSPSTWLDLLGGTAIALGGSYISKNREVNIALDTMGATMVALGIGKIITGLSTPASAGLRLPRAPVSRTPVRTPVTVRAPTYTAPSTKYI